MAAPAPFAYGPLGDVLIATDNAWVCVSPTGKQGPRWRDQAAAPIAGVRDARDGVFAVDAKGVVIHLARADGTVLGRADCAVEVTGLSATAVGVWAVSHPAGMCVGLGGKLQRKLRLEGLTCAALDASGDWLAMGTQAGDVHVIGLSAASRRSLRLKGAITGLAFSRLVGWYVCTADTVYRADLDLARHEQLIDSDNAVSGCAASPDGSLCAFRMGRHRVVVIGPKGEQLGAVYYPERLVGEIEFGPFPWLGVGIGEGDGNRSSLLEDNVIHRTEALAGRPVNEWQVSSEFARDKVIAEREGLRGEGLLAEAVDVVEEEDEGVVAMAAEVVEAVAPRLRRPRRKGEAPGTPFVLEPHERVLLRGGFGGKFAWGWTIGHLVGLLGGLPILAVMLYAAVVRRNVPLALALAAAALVPLASALWPLLRSGRYWLTNLRLHWKPRLGSAVAVRLVDVDEDRIAVSAATSSLKVRGEQTVALRYVSDVERLWGGLILFSQLNEFEPSEAGARTDVVACWPAQLVELTTSQQGMAVLRPEYFAFLPSEEKTSVLGQATNRVAGDLAGKVFAGDDDDDEDEEDELNAKLPIDLLLEVLFEKDPLTFDDYVYQAVEAQDGIVWEPGDAEVVKEAFPLQPSRHVLLFTKKRRTVRGVPTREREAFVDKVVREWTDGEAIPVKQPVWRMAKVSLIFTVPAVLFAIGGFQMAGDAEREAWEPGLAYGFAGVLGLLGLLCWLLTAAVTLRAMRRSGG